jgi:hypothetical protein
MKQIITAVFVLMAFVSFGQKKIVWFDAGLKAQYGAGGLYNAAVGKASDRYDYTISTGYSYGAKLGINKNYNGLSIDVMRSSLKQTLDVFGIANTKSTTVNWTSTDIYALFRNAQNMGYFEIGPKMSLISKVENQTDAGLKAETTQNFNENVFSGVIGFGANIMGTEDRFSGILGLRFEYAFTDFNKVADPSTGTLAPLNDPSIYANGYKTSNIAFAGVVFEANWGIGYYGKAQCGKRPKFIMF